MGSRSAEAVPRRILSAGASYTPEAFLDALDPVLHNLKEAVRVRLVQKTPDLGEETVECAEPFRAPVGPLLPAGLLRFFSQELLESGGHV
jgi:hypothetical protein